MGGKSTSLAFFSLPDPAHGKVGVCIYLYTRTRWSAHVTRVYLHVLAYIVLLARLRAYCSSEEWTDCMTLVRQLTRALVPALYGHDAKGADLIGAPLSYILVESPEGNTSESSTTLSFYDFPRQVSG